MLRPRPLVVLALAAGWFFWLSGRLGVVPGSVLVDRIDAFFQSDLAFSLAVFGGLPPPDHLWIVHPLVPSLWSWCIRAATGWSASSAWQLWTARWLVALVAGAGVASIVELARRLGASTRRTAVLAILALLASANVLVALPEHFGLAAGCMAVGFVAWMLGRPLVSWLGVALAAGTTITHGALAILLGLAQLRHRRAWLIVLVLALASCGTLWLMRNRFGPYVTRYAHGRLVQAPSRSLEYAAFGLVAPIVAPQPRIWSGWRDPHGGRWPPAAFKVTFEPVHLEDYDRVGTLAVAAWAALLAVAMVECWEDRSTRSGLIVLVGWLAFNLALSNLWGDEFFLYSPHWSWALLTIIAMALPRLDRGILFVASTLVILGQVRALEQLITATDLLRTMAH